MKKLPTYKGYTVDFRLKEFRRLEPVSNKLSSPFAISFYPFNSNTGDQLLAEMIKKDLVPQETLINLF